MRYKAPPPRPTRAAAFLAALLLSLPFGALALWDLARWIVAGG